MKNQQLLISKSSLCAARDVFLLVILILAPTLIIVVNKTPLISDSMLGMIDEFVIMVMSLIIVIRILQGKVTILKKEYLLFAVYFLYSLFLILKNSLPISHCLQIFLTGKFFIAYFYFDSLNNKQKGVVLNKLIGCLFVMFLISMFVSMIELFVPSLVADLKGLSLDVRGALGFGLASIFSSRVFFAEFLIILMVLVLSNYHISMKNIVFLHVKKNIFAYAILMLLLFATASRKEFVFAVMLYVFIAPLVKGRIFKLSNIFIAIVATAGTVFILTYLFKDINAVALSDKYVRFQLFIISFNIFFDYFPLGSGPGTFGSTMSIPYGKVYEVYDVGKSILGYDGAARGPIYDLFLFTTMAEYGLGILIFFAFGFVIYRRQTALSVCRGYLYNTALINKGLILMILFFSIFTPILTNWVGILAFSILGLVHRER